MGFLGNIVKGFANSNPIGMIANAATSVIGGAITQNMANKQQQRNQERQNAWQAEQAQISRNWQADQAALQNEWSEKMNLQQQEWQEGMWNKTNEWNSEGARMQRLIDAGVNPNNAAGLVSGNQTAAQLAQQPQIPTANPYPSTSVPSGGQMSGPTILDGMNAMANMKLAEAQTRLVNAQAEGQELHNPSIPKIDEQTINSLSAKSASDASRAKLDDAQREHVTNFLNPYYNELKGKTHEEADKIRQEKLNEVKQGQILDKEISVKQKELDKLEEVIKNLQQERKESDSRIALNQQQQATLASQQRLNDALAEQARLKNALDKLEKDRQEWRNDFIDKYNFDPYAENADKILTFIIGQLEGEEFKPTDSFDDKGGMFSFSDEKREVLAKARKEHGDAAVDEQLRKRGYIYNEKGEKIMELNKAPQFGSSTSDNNP